METNNSGKKFGIATLFTHEAVTMLGENNVSWLETFTEDSAIKIKRLNGNQTSAGLEAFIQEYQDVILVVAKPDDQGPMNKAAKAEGITVIPADQVMELAERSWGSPGVR